MGCLFLNYAAADELLAIVPGGKLTGRNAPLGLVEEQVGSLGATVEGCTLQGLAVAYASQVATRLLANGLSQILPHPMNLLGDDAQSPAEQSGVVVALTDVDNVALYIGGNYKQNRFYF